MRDNSSQRVALYQRVSTHQQTTENQRLELEQYAERQGWSVVKIYDDSGISGTRNDRPGLNEMLKDAEAGKFDMVCVYSVCRLGRSTLDLLTVLKRLQDCNVGFVSISQGINSKSSAGRILAQFLSILSQWERELIVDRVRAGISRARAQGVQLGRPRVAIDLKTALRLRGEGLGYKQIARQMNIPRSTLYDTFRAMQGIRQTPAAN